MPTLAIMHEALDTPASAGDFAALAARTPPQLIRWPIEAVVGVLYLYALASSIVGLPDPWFDVAMWGGVIPILAVIAYEGIGAEADARHSFACAWVMVHALRAYDADIEERVTAGLSTGAVAQWLTRQIGGPRVSAADVQAYRDAMIERRLDLGGPSPRSA